MLHFTHCNTSCATHADLQLSFSAINPSSPPPDAKIPVLISPQAVNTTTAGPDLPWSASIINPESQRYSSGPARPYISRTIIFNENCLQSICMWVGEERREDARQIRPSEGPFLFPSFLLLLPLIYGSASFPLPVMLRRAAISTSHLAGRLPSRGDRPCD